jgi:hypothetical protein
LFIDSPKVIRRYGTLLPENHRARCIKSDPLRLAALGTRGRNEAKPVYQVTLK